MATSITNYTTYDLEEQARFNDGALKGQILYRQCYQGKVVRPRELYDFLMTTLLDATHSRVWMRAAFAGWFRALHQDESMLSKGVLAQHVSVLLQQLQAHLCNVTKEKEEQ
jgi:hypothetical protein